MALSLSPKAVASLEQLVENATKSTREKPVLPGVLLHIVDAQNTTLFTHGSGSPHTPTADSISDVQSLTKLVGAIAYMQLVERGLATLDDPATITTHLPELAAKKVLTGFKERADGSKEWQFEDRKGEITPRMLLNHTYGGGHTYFNALLFEYFQDHGIWEGTNEVGDTYGTVLAAPLLYHPGTRTNYGQGLDWIAVLIERITQQHLASYLQRTLFDPLHLNSTGLEAAAHDSVTNRPANNGKFWPWKLRTAEDSFLDLDPTAPFPVPRDNAFPTGEYHTGRLGAGLVASAADYARLLTILLPANAGVDPLTGHRVLSRSSVAEITSAQLPARIRNASRNVPASGASPIVLPGVLDAPNRDPEGSFGLGCGVQGEDRVLDGGRKGRSGGSVYWYGAANTEYWVDGEKGVVVFLNGNFFPWNDGAWVEFVACVEGEIYEGLR